MRWEDETATPTQQIPIPVAGAMTFPRAMDVLSTGANTIIACTGTSTPFDISIMTTTDGVNFAVTDYVSDTIGVQAKQGVALAEGMQKIYMLKSDGNGEVWRADKVDGLWSRNMGFFPPLNYAAPPEGLGGGNISYNIIENNRARGLWAQGGGLFRCHGRISENVIIGNTAGTDCGGMARCSSLAANNIIFYSNNCIGKGGGVYDFRGLLVNNTIYGNTASVAGGGLADSWHFIRSCIIWGNNAPQSPQVHNSKQFSYCDIEGWQDGGSHNIAIDPEFVSALTGNFHLTPLSPCIDAGGRFPDVTIDFEGDPRPYDAAQHRWGDGYNYDIGADEFIGN